MIRVQLPLPTSVNSMYATRRGSGRGKIISRDYSLWRKEAEAAYLQQKIAKTVGDPIKGHFSVDIVFDQDRRRHNSDVDSRIKASLDFLQRMELIENDCLCDSVSATWGPVPGCLIRAYPTTIA